MSDTEIKFSQESLEALVIAIMELTDESGRLISIKPTHVLVPWVVKQIPNWEEKVQELFKSVYVQPTRAGRGTGQ